MPKKPKLQTALPSSGETFQSIANKPDVLVLAEIVNDFIGIIVAPGRTAQMRLRSIQERIQELLPHVSE